MDPERFRRRTGLGRHHVARVPSRVGRCFRRGPTRGIAITQRLATRLVDDINRCVGVIHLDVNICVLVIFEYHVHDARAPPDSSEFPAAATVAIRAGANDPGQIGPRETPAPHGHLRTVDHHGADDRAERYINALGDSPDLVGAGEADHEAVALDDDLAHSSSVDGIYTIEDVNQDVIKTLASKGENVIEDVRGWLGGGIRQIIGGTRDVPERPARTDGGLAGPGSAMWAVHSDIAGLTGGLRALLLQTLHPMVMAGVADHSNYRTDPLGRLHRTAAFLARTTYGSRREAEEAIEAVRAIHSRINGVAPDGRPYQACDPHLLAWVHCTEVDSFLKARIRYGATPLGAGVPDAYVAEMAEIARRLGSEDPPTDVAGLKARLWAFRPELEVNHQARDTIRFLRSPPASFAVRAPYRVVFAASVGLLPGFARRMLVLPLPPLADPLAIRPAATVLLRTIGWALGPGPEPTEEPVAL